MFLSRKGRLHLDCDACVGPTLYKPTASLSAGIGVRANIHLGVKPNFARISNTNCLSRGPAREKKNELLQWVFFTIIE